MRLFEKIINNELNTAEMFLTACLMKTVKRFKQNVEHYGTVSNDLKYMFLIQEAEKDIMHDEYLRNADFYAEFSKERGPNEKLYLRLFD